MMVLTLGRTILLMGVWARNMMSYANAMEERVQGLILSPPNQFGWRGFYDRIGVQHVVGNHENTEKLQIYGAKDRPM
jgi:hypothetical protein